MFRVQDCFGVSMLQALMRYTFEVCITLGSRMQMTAKRSAKSIIMIIQATWLGL
jgi:hypothetical protein